ncbi:MAG: DUF445 family protein [Candidatus Acidulodesulfobacterium sp.]
MNLNLKYKKNKILANLFLLAAFLIFLLSYIAHSNNILVFLLQRASAAALIGGIADWFAVTALFKYPLGIHISHTNTIKNNKEKIINSISNMVNDVWLGKNYLASEISGINFSDIILTVIKKDKNKNKFMLTSRKLILKFINSSKTDNFQNFLNKNIDKALDKTLSDDNLSKNIINKFALFLESQDADDIYYTLIKYINLYVKKYNAEELSKKITGTYSDDIIKSIKSAGNKLIEENFADIISNLSGFVIVNIEENRTYLKQQIADILEKYKSDSALKNILMFVAEKTNIIDIERLSNEIIAKIIDFIKDIKNNENNEVRLNIKDYILNTLNDIDKTSHMQILNAIETAVNENADKIKDYIINRLNDEELKKTIKNKLSNFVNSEGLNIISSYKDRLKTTMHEAIINFIGSILKNNKEYIVNKKLFKEKFNYFFILIENEIYKNTDKIDAFLKNNIIYLMKINHSAIGKLIRKNLESLDEDQLVAQIEDKIGEDLQFIRINGAITGSVIGIIIAVLSLFLKKI